MREGREGEGYGETERGREELKVSYPGYRKKRYIGEEREEKEVIYWRGESRKKREETRERSERK